MHKFFIQNKILNLSCVAIVIFFVASCGFTPIYQKNGISSKSGVDSDCANISVESASKTRLDQIFKYELMDRLESACILNKVNEGKRTIKITPILDISKEAVSIQKDRSITRFNMKILTEYKIYDDGEVIFEGKRSLKGGFDDSDSDYGTFAQENDTSEKLTKELARDISLKIISKLSQ